MSRNALEMRLLVRQFITQAAIGAAVDCSPRASATAHFTPKEQT
jgi:hypothetical protein